MAQGLQPGPAQLRLQRDDGRRLGHRCRRDVRSAARDRRDPPRTGLARVLAQGLGLPEIDLATETGDVTVHLSCTTHMSQPPVDRERRVLYTGFSLPPTDPEAVAAARQRLYRIMQSIPEGVSQKPATVGA